MSRQDERKAKGAPREKAAIGGIVVSGYKSICDRQEIEVRPLTILAGANSSGKSSMMQPLLLLKQTLEAPYDPGALLLNGPNVRFNAVDQLLCQIERTEPKVFRVGVRRTDGVLVVTSFAKGNPLDVCETTEEANGSTQTLRPDTTSAEVAEWVPEPLAQLLNALQKRWGERGAWRVKRDRCFLTADFEPPAKADPGFGPRPRFQPGDAVASCIREVIHLPGLRGNPQRTYPLTAVARAFPGTFEQYTASVIAQWEAQDVRDKIDGLSRDLDKLKLTWKVFAKRVSDTEVELSVGRLLKAARGGAYDKVNIADVGFGVSQVLPLIVALHAADAGQLVYVEQPELHLHPRAQAALADVLAEAAQRGIQVVAETHSDKLLLGVQAAVASGRLPAELVKLHWFQRAPDGATTVHSADLDERGAFGDWPEDFADVAMEAESGYLDAVESHHGQK